VISVKKAAQAAFLYLTHVEISYSRVRHCP